MGLRGFLFVLLQIVSLCGATEYYVRPTEPTNKSCPGQPCLTINQYTNDSDHYFKSNTVFKFLLGTHELYQPVYMKNVSNVSLESYIINNTNRYPLLAGGFSGSLAHCTDGIRQCTALTFYNVHNVTIRGIGVDVMLQNTYGVAVLQSSIVSIQITIGCIQPTTYGVVIKQASLVNISSTTVTGCSDGITLQNTNFTKIFNSTVSYNTDKGLYLYQVFHVTIHSFLSIYNGIGVFSNNTVNSSITNTNANYNTLEGMHFERTDHTQIVKTEARLNKDVGLFLTHGKNTSISHIFATQNFGRGIMVTNCDTVTVSNITAISNKMDGVFLMFTINVTISNIWVRSNNNAGLTLYNTAETRVINITANFNIYYGMLLILTTNTYVTDSIIECSPYGIYIESATDTATEHTVIANSSVRMCPKAGIWLEGAVDTRIYNTTTRENTMDIVLNSTKNAYITNVTVMSSDITRGLTLLNARNIIIEDVQVVKYNYSTNQTLKSHNVRVNEVIYLENCNNSILKLHFSMLTRGITIYNSRNTTLRNSLLCDMTYPTILSSSDPSGLPANYRTVFLLFSIIPKYF